MKHTCQDSLRLILVVKVTKFNVTKVIQKNIFCQLLYIPM